jgi:hypothetical protein
MLIGAEGEDDEHDLESLQHHALECDRERVGVEPLPDDPGRGCRRPLLFVLLRFVAKRRDPGSPQDGLSQPLQAECEQESADHEAQGVDWKGGQRRSKRRR